MEKIYQEMRSMLNEQRELLIVGHEDPDCDCLGSMLGLYLAFDGEEKNWRMLRRDPVPANLAYLPHLDKMIDPAELDIPGQAVLLLDCGEARRTGSWLADMLPGKKLYCIDHHISNAFQGDLALVEPEAGAASEIVAALALADGRKISDEAALCLYSGMAADTGCFRYNNTSPRSLA
ncbi:MAG: DHH family phosphoesterase, partial [Firmicutes bacterium]|nr:DHH family phosphoesterase [Bacillota bacterium]